MSCRAFSNANGKNKEARKIEKTKKISQVPQEEVNVDLWTRTRRNKQNARQADDFTINGACRYSQFKGIR